MTEAEWLACTDPTSMLTFLGNMASDRKLRLFALACAQRNQERWSPWLGSQAIETVEKYVDQQSTSEELTRFVHRSPRKWGDEDSGWYRLFQTERFDADAAAEIAQFAAAWAGAKTTTHHAYLAARDAMRKVQCSLLRDLIVPVLFRPVGLSPASLTWNGETVPKIARAIYDERAFDQMPILADALEEAGCTDAAILDHCRQPGEHVRGCWVVDMLLGKQ
jgi:hypothetical protein